jgi:hypothetical protein
MLSHEHFAIVVDQVCEIHCLTGDRRDPPGRGLRVRHGHHGARLHYRTPLGRAYQLRRHTLARARGAGHIARSESR